MSPHVIEQLTFRPASEKPAAEMHGRDVLVYNPCDGWHEGEIHAFEENGEIYQVGIYTFCMEEMTPHNFYVAWALLPGSIEFGKQFESERDPYRHPGLDG